MSDVIDNRAESRFELEVDGHVGFAAYEIDGDVITFTHTIVPDALQGRGVASRLIGGALKAARERKLRVVPQCSFVAAYIDKHPETQDLV